VSVMGFHHDSLMLELCNDDNVNIQYHSCSSAEIHDVNHKS